MVKEVNTLHASVILFTLAVLLLLIAPSSYAAYGKKLCKQAGYYCLKVQRGDSWKKLWPNKEQRDIVRHANRMNTRLRRGMIIAVPENLAFISKMDIAPMSDKIDPPGRKLVIVHLKKLAWGAYNPDGELVNWAPISGGKNYCPDVRRACRTAKGKSFAMYSKRGSGCVSRKYPLGRGGAKMPYCMFFYRGFAIHGSPTVPGYHASHGCVRTFTDQARWLNQEFIELPRKSNGYRGTKVIVM